MRGPRQSAPNTPRHLINAHQPTLPAISLHFTFIKYICTRIYIRKNVHESLLCMSLASCMCSSPLAWWLSDQYAVPPPSNAPGGESGISKDNDSLSVCGANSPPRVYIFIAFDRCGADVCLSFADARSYHAQIQRPDYVSRTQSLEALEGLNGDAICTHVRTDHARSTHRARTEHARSTQWYLGY